MLSSGGTALIYAFSSWNLLYPLGVSAFFLCFSLFELLNAQRIERAPAGASSGAGGLTVEQIAQAAGLKEGEFGDFEYGGDSTSRFGTVLAWGSSLVLVELKRDALLEQRIAHVRELSSRLEGLKRAFEEARRAEAARQEKFADLIVQLEVEQLVFNHAEDVRAAEVYFTSSTGGEYWWCALQGDTFFDLSRM